MHVQNQESVIYFAILYAVKMLILSKLISVFIHVCTHTQCYTVYAYTCLYCIHCQTMYYSWPS